MPGRQWMSFWEGNRAELMATYVLSSIAAVVPVPRQFDFGADLLCTLTRRKEGALYAGKSFSVQVKSASVKHISYGGLDKNGNWKNYEIDWLFGQSQPIIICIVDQKQWLLRLYSTLYMWSLRWLIGSPAEVNLVPDMELNHEESETGEYPSESLENGETFGDGRSYLVPLGKPIVEISLDQEDDQDFRDNLRLCLDRWLFLEIKNIIYRQMGVPFIGEYRNWKTNIPPEPPLWYSQFWNDGHDMNIPQIMNSIGPALTSLMLNLNAQGQSEKLGSVLPMARMARDYGALDPQGVDFLNRLDSE